MHSVARWAEGYQTYKEKSRKTIRSGTLGTPPHSGLTSFSQRTVNAKPKRHKHTIIISLAYRQQVRAVAETIGLDADLMQHPKIEVAQRRVARISPMPGLAQSTSSLSKHEDR